MDLNESDGFALMVRRKPQLRLVAFAWVVTLPEVRRRAFMVHDFRIALLSSIGEISFYAIFARNLSFFDYASYSNEALAYL